MESIKGGLSDSMKRSAYQWGIGRYLYKFESVWVPLRDGKYIDVPPSVPEWALPENYRYMKNIVKEQSNHIKDINHIRKEENMKTNISNNKNHIVSDIHSYSELISEKQVNLFNIRSKDKNKEKVLQMLARYGYCKVEDICKKDFNGILYYLNKIDII